MAVDRIWIGNIVGSLGDYGVANNWRPTAVPLVTDNVRIGPISSQAILGTLDQSAVAIGDFIVEDGYSQIIGGIGTGLSEYLQIDPNRFEFSGTGESYINIGTAAIDVLINKTKVPATGERGLYLLGTAINELSVVSGYVGLAHFHGEVSTVTTASTVTAGASLICGEDVTLTTANVQDGSMTLHCGATTVNSYGGITTIELGGGSITTINVFGGEVRLGNSNTITNLVVRDGYVNADYQLIGKTITNLTLHPGAEFSYDPDFVTITNWLSPDSPIKHVTSRP